MPAAAQELPVALNPTRHRQFPHHPVSVPVQHYTYAGKQQLRINSSSLPSVPSPASSPHSSPVKSNVYGFGQQRSFTSIPGMLFEQIMQVRGVS
jgi:hypothetical protein